MVGAAFAHRHCEQVPFRGRGEVNECFFKASSVLRGVPPPARRGSQVPRKRNLPGCLTLVRKKTRTECLRRALASCGGWEDGRGTSRCGGGNGSTPCKRRQ